MAIRQIRENGDEILRKKSREVDVVDDKIRELLDDMLETMHKYNGVGLAAPQVGILKRVVVIDLYDDNGPLKLVNPKIVFIGVGEDNKFGHPNNGVLERLGKYINKIYRTDKNGEIELLYKNGKIKINTIY